MYIPKFPIKFQTNGSKNYAFGDELGLIVAVAETSVIAQSPRVQLSAWTFRMKKIQKIISKKKKKGKKKLILLRDGSRVGRAASHIPNPQSCSNKY